ELRQRAARPPGVGLALEECEGALTRLDGRSKLTGEYVGLREPCVRVAAHLWQSRALGQLRSGTAVTDRRFQSRAREALQEAEPVVPGGPPGGIRRARDDVANALEHRDVVAMTSKREQDLGLLRDGVDTPEPIRLGVRGGLQARQRAPEIREGLGVGPPVLRPFRGLDRVVDGAVVVVAELEMVREQLHDLADPAL